MGYDDSIRQRLDDVKDKLNAAHAAIKAMSIAALDGTVPDLAAVSELQAIAAIYEYQIVELSNRHALSHK